jgi:putative cardiolipin synthase
MVVDGRIACIGTFNFDPRSENLNTEVAAIIHHEGLAQRLLALMEADRRPENSWSAADEPDQYVPLTKRGQVRVWQLLPLKPLL